MPRLCSSLLLWLLFTSSASAVTMDWTFVGDPGNAADGTGFGSVPYSYNIGTYEVTNGQYADFLNAKASSDPFSLYNVFMGDPSTAGLREPVWMGAMSTRRSPGARTFR